MSEKSEALRLANFLEMHWCNVDMPEAKAAAELRFLHAENEELRRERDEARRTVREAHEAGTRLTAQRDALLEALKRMASIIDKMGDMPDGFIHPSPWQELKCEEALTQARAAIQMVEEGK